MLRRLFASALLMISFCSGFAVLAPAYVSAAGPCDQASAFDIIPRWYKYLGNELDSNCQFTNFQWNDIWKIGLAVLEILLRIAGIVAFIYIVIGGFRFVLSRGNPQEAVKARQTLIDAIIGMGIAMLATVLVAFIGRTLSK